MDLQNTTVCITGGNDGLGLAMVKLLAKLCKKVIVIDRADQQFFDEKLEYIKMDLSEEKPEIEEVDIFISNLGMSVGFKYVDSISYEDVLKMLRVNVELPLWFYKNVKWKKFVFINSVMSFVGMEGFALYSASKGFIRLFNEGLQREKANTLIVFPYKLNTGMFSEVNDYGTLDVKDVAKDVIEGIEKDKKEIYLPFVFRYVEAMKGTMPVFVRNFVLDKVNKYYVKEELVGTEE
ncbi:hypothetical protein P3W45_000383 [Vairimorpha bombi]|jgi:short-subunit dehydrogenase